MPYRIDSDDAIAKAVERLGQRARGLHPATRKWAELIVRKARRQVPVGRGRGRGALKRSLNHREPAHNVTVLQSDRRYARIIQEGGAITAGTGPLGSRLLAIPLNDDARRMLDGMGASVSLRTQNLLFLKSRSGRMFLIRQERAGRGGRRKRGKARRHRMFEGQILFMLVPRVTIRARPYAPRVSDPDVREAAARFIREHLTKR